MPDKNVSDYRKVDQPKADNLFSNPNTLEDLLQDLTDFENWSNTDNIFQSVHGDRPDVDEREPYDGIEKAEKVVKKKAAEEKNPGIIKKDIENLDEKNIHDILEDYLDYEKYLGIANNDLVGFKDHLVDTKEFPMDTKSKIAKLKGK
jgi:hypothetical protein